MRSDRKAPAGAGALARDSVKACVICGKPQTDRYKPFCSKRCADIDLHRWFSGAYAVPGKADEDEDGTGSPSEDRS
jgi:endogenous inhibitor of DNA gyrase (YacG/DUF329 family)